MQKIGAYIIIRFFTEQVMTLLRSIPRIFPWLLKAIPRLFGWFITSGIPAIGKGIWGFFKLLLNGLPMYLGKIIIFFTELPFKIIGKLAGFLGKWKPIQKIGEELFYLRLRIVDGVKKFFTETISRYWNNIISWAKTALTNLPFGIGKAFKNIGSIIPAVTNIAKASKAIPVLGAVATAGFGAVESYKMFKEHGAAAGWATVTKTVAATGLAAAGMTPASLAVDLGGSALIHGALKLAEMREKNKEKATEQAKKDVIIQINAEGNPTPIETLKFELDEEDKIIDSMSLRLGTEGGP